MKSRVNSPFHHFVRASKSATIHTHKARVPKAAIFLAVTPLLLAGLIYVLYGWWSGIGGKAEEAKAPASAPAPTVQASREPERRMRKEEPDVMAQWIEARMPRIPDFPHTAPIYDRVTEPVTAPLPAACVDWPGKGCRCYTQQATRMNVSEAMCRQIAETGYFVDFDVASRHRDDKSEL